MYRVHLVHDSQLDLPDLFEALADHENLSQVFGVPVRRIRDGQDDPNGLGSVRKIGPGPLGIEETVTAIETDRAIEYRISRGGFPLKNHRGELRFFDAAQGSRVEWTIEFESHLPLAGPVLRFVLGQAIGRGLKRLG